MASFRKMVSADFEDNVQIACALAAGLDLIISRDSTDFTHSPITAVLPLAIGHYVPGSAEPGTL